MCGLEVSPTFFSYMTMGMKLTLHGSLANMQLRLHLGHIFRRFNVTTAPHTTPESMEHVEIFTIRPKAGKCDLLFDKIE